MTVELAGLSVTLLLLGVALEGVDGLAVLFAGVVLESTPLVTTGAFWLWLPGTVMGEMSLDSGWEVTGGGVRVSFAAALVAAVS